MFCYWCQLCLCFMVTTGLADSGADMKNFTWWAAGLASQETLFFPKNILFFPFTNVGSFLAYFYKWRQKLDVLLCHRLHSAVAIMEDVITWCRWLAVILRSAHKSEAECFVAAGQSSCGKRQMWDSRSIWAKPHWCQQADRRWRHKRDQRPPENSWSETEGGADSRLAAASC